jgi:hypothetical protein
MLPTIPFLSRLQYLSYDGSNGDTSWLGLEPMHVATKLTILPGLFLQDEQLLSLPIFSTTLSLREKLDGTDGQANSGEYIYGGGERNYAVIC